MNREIEDMAKTLCGQKEHSCAECDSCDLCEFWLEASILYANGYRKSTDVAREILGRLSMLIKTAESQEFFKGKMSWVVDSDELLDFIKNINKEFSEGENE